MFTILSFCPQNHHKYSCSLPSSGYINDQLIKLCWQAISISGLIIHSERLKYVSKEGKNNQPAAPGASTPTPTSTSCPAQISRLKKRLTFSKLTRLKELSIDVNPDDQWWDEEANAILDGMFWLTNLKTLNLYLPTVELLKRFLQLKIYPALSHLKLTVGHHDQRIISRLPEKLEEKFKNFDKCLKYKNGKGETIEITEALKHSSAFFLDRHWTVTNLSEFQIHEMKQLKFCLLLECNEMQTIINGADEKDNDEYGSKGDKPVLTSLEHLHILYMKNFKSILEGRIVSSSLSRLKTLAIHTCPKLTTIFTLHLVRNFVNLEELIVEDCPKIERLIGFKSDLFEPNVVLLSLKKVSLLDLPELISMFSGLEIAPVLEIMTIYNCPKLKKLYTSEVSSKNLKAIKGEKEWWGELKWHNLWGSRVQPDHLVSIFVPLRWDRDLMAQLTEDPAAESSVLENEDAFDGTESSVLENEDAFDGTESSHFWKMKIFLVEYSLQTWTMSMEAVNLELLLI
ncbi:hypothetical protein F0562_003787 [Nyssa sinensis]|uniref:Disease resistance protein At4g27190-like leucine-rich repeats domain-containing protein n=1 Tax=Nyssa sinensis TaxID=561372 RepID=A0A5J5BWI3_9ASTE|nr:hypothetical protein F0562_003787 [Nyssa sinensis]